MTAASQPPGIELSAVFFILKPLGRTRVSSVMNARNPHA